MRRTTWLVFLAFVIMLVPKTAQAQDDPWVEWRPIKALRLLNMAETFLYSEFPLEAAAACDQDKQAREQRQQEGRQTESDATCNKAVMITADIISIWSGGTAAPVDAVAAWCNAAEIETAAKPYVLAWIQYQRERPFTDLIMRRSDRERMQREAQQTIGTPFAFVILMLGNSVGIVETSWRWSLK